MREGQIIINYSVIVAFYSYLETKQNKLIKRA